MLLVPVITADTKALKPRKPIKLTETRYTKEVFWAGWRIFEVPKQYRAYMVDFDIDSVLDNYMRYGGLGD
jgi:hypothetical protein